MLTRRTLLLCATSFGATSLSATSLSAAETAQPDDASALAFVKAIYATFTKPGSDGVSIDSGKKLRRYFEPELAETMNKDQEDAARHHDEGKLDFDPFIDAQDWEFKQFDVVLKDTSPGKITATVTFNNLKELTTIVLDLIAIKNDWRIYDITWQRDPSKDEPKTLRALFGLPRAS
jgi:Protein of unknown function (DUF3828)